MTFAVVYMELCLQGRSHHSGEGTGVPAGWEARSSGFVCGVVESLRRAGWGDVPIIAMETVGAHSLNAAMKVGEVVTLPSITR